MKKWINGFRNQKLMRQLLVLFLVQLVVVSALNIVLIYQNNLNVYIEERSGQALNLAGYAAKNLENTEGIAWLTDYWREHEKTMDIVYDSEEATGERKREFEKTYPQYNIDSLKEETMKKMPESAQKAYAEYAYMALMDDFNRLKRTYHPTYLFCFYPKSDTELFYYLTGTEEGEKRGDSQDDIYRLGTVSKYPKEDYPVMIRTWESGLVQDELEQPVKHGELSGFYHMYVPVRSGERTLCLIGVTLETNTVKRELQNKLFLVEGLEIFGFILTGLLLFLLVHGVILRPVSRLHKVMLGYKQDKDSRRVEDGLKKVVSRNEIGQLAGEFTGLTKEVDRHVQDILRITAEQERLNAELSLAIGIQLDMIPGKFQERPEIALAGSMEPAREVGGDFFDFFYVDDNHLALVVGDVSGKGIPAALFMVRSMTVIRNYVMLGLPVEEVFMRTNEELCRGNDSELFTTAWLGIYEIDSGRLVFTEAGHDEPVLVRNTGDTEMVKPVKKRLVLGAMPGIRYLASETALQPGDVILLYTDGVPEANNESEELYGMERFCESVQRHGHIAQDSVEEFLAGVRSDISEFVGQAEQFDDLTMLALSVRHWTA